MPISSATSLSASAVVLSSPAVPAASARKTNRMGTQMPSLSPLSTFRPSRILAGTDFVGHHRLAQGRIGGRQHGRQDGDLEQGQSVEQQHTDPEPEQDGQRQSDQQQALGDLDAFLEHPEIGIGRIGEQHQGERQLGQGAQTLGIDVQGQQSQTRAGRTPGRRR